MTPTATAQSLSEEAVARLTAGHESPDAVRRPAEASTDALLADDLFHLLQNSRRRAVLRYLRGRQDSVRMRDVAEQVAAWEHGTTVAQLSSDERQRVYSSLYRSHLDTLADASVIAYNKSHGVIEPQPMLDHVASYLDMDAAAPLDTDADEDPWPGRYLGAVAVSTLLLVGIALDLAAFELLSGVAVSALILGLFTGMTVAKLILAGDKTA